MTRDLSNLMEFDHVIRVQDGIAIDRESNGDRIKLYAPECYWQGFSNEHIEPGQAWELLNGYSGQHRYSGPIMHASEYIGGRMADDILATDGYYVTVVCNVLRLECSNCYEPADLPEDDSCPKCLKGTMQPSEDAAGWAVAHQPLKDEA